MDLRNSSHQQIPFGQDWDHMHIAIIFGAQRGSVSWFDSKLAGRPSRTSPYLAALLADHLAVDHDLLEICANNTDTASLLKPSMPWGPANDLLRNGSPRPPRLPMKDSVWDTC